MGTRTLLRFVRFVVGAIVCGTTGIAWHQAAVVPSGGSTNVDWPVYRGDQKGNQYSPLAQIHAANVHTLERAWEVQDRRRQPAIHDARQSDRGERRHVRDDGQPEGCRAERGDRQGDLVVRSSQAQQRHRRATAEPRPGALEGGGGRAHLPFRARSRLRTRREVRRAHHDVRQGRVHRSPPGSGRGSGVGGHRDDLARRRVQELPDRRVARQRELRCVARAHPRVQHRVRRAQVDVPHHSARGAGGPRLVEVGQGGELRRRECLGRRDNRRNARMGVCRDRLGHRGLLRWISQGRQPLCQLGPGARRDDRRTEVALSDRSTRHLGLRQSSGANPRHHRVRTHCEGRRRAAHEDGLHVRPRSGHGQAAVSGRRRSCAALDGTG